MSSVTFNVCVRDCIGGAYNAPQRIEALLRQWVALVDVHLWYKSQGTEVFMGLTKKAFMASVPELLSQLRMDPTPNASRVKTESEMRLELDVINTVSSELFFNMEQLLTTYVQGIQLQYIEQGSWVRIVIDFV